MFRKPGISAVSPRSALATNTVLRNTYMLLGMTIVFSACTAYVAMATNARPMGFFTFLIGMFALSYLVNILRNSASGILAVFAYTGFLGYFAGPIVHYYMYSLSNGGQIVMTALGATGTIFIGLSGYVLATGKDFSFMGGLLMVGIFACLILSCIGALFNIPALSLVISGFFALICSGLIMHHTSEIIHGGETNYITATVSLYVAIFNLFMSLLRILAIFAGQRD